MKNRKRNWIIILIFLLYPLLMALTRVMADPYAGDMGPDATTANPTSLGTYIDSSGNRVVQDNFGGVSSSDGNLIVTLPNYLPQAGTGSINTSGVIVTDPLGN